MIPATLLLWFMNEDIFSAYNSSSHLYNLLSFHAWFDWHNFKKLRTNQNTHTHGGFWSICEHYFEVILNTLFKYTKYLQSVLFWCNFLRTFCTTATTRCPLVEKIQSAWAFARIFGFVDYRTTHTYTYIRVFAWLALEAFSSELLLVLAPLLLGSPCWGLCWHLRTSWLYFNNSCNS